MEHIVYRKFIVRQSIIPHNAQISFSHKVSICPTKFLHFYIVSAIEKALQISMHKQLNNETNKLYIITRSKRYKERTIERLILILNNIKKRSFNPQNFMPKPKSNQLSV